MATKENISGAATQMQRHHKRMATMNKAAGNAQAHNNRHVGDRPHSDNAGRHAAGAKGSPGTTHAKPIAPHIIAAGGAVQYYRR